MSKWIIGIDIGGTSVKFGLFSRNGELLFKWSILTRIEEDGNYIIDDLWSSLVEKLKEHRLEHKHILGIGIGIPGFVDTKKGQVYEAVNLGWKFMAFIKEMKKRTNLPIFVENDANAAVLGENWKGAGKQAKHLLVVTLGTGVGGGIISNGSLLNGYNNMAGELGHIYAADNGVRCNCGNKGCLETIASSTGIVRQAEQAVKAYPNSLLNEKYIVDNRLSIKDVFQFAIEGDQAAMKIVDDTAQTLGIVLANICVVLNPEKILIGGGVSKVGSFFINKINSAFEEKASKRVKEVCELKQTELGNDAGIFGAAFLVKQNMESVSL